MLQWPETMLFLRFLNEAVSIERTFKDVSTVDGLWGYYVVVRMGRLDSLFANFSMRVTAIKRTNSSERVSTRFRLR